MLDAKKRLIDELGWTEESAVLISGRFAETILDIEDSGLEGVGYPVVLTPINLARRTIKLSESVSPAEFLSITQGSTREATARVFESIGRVGKVPEKTLILTGAVVANFTQEQLRELLSRPEAGISLVELDTPGELEMDRGRAIIGIPEIERCGLDGEGETVAILDGEILPHRSLEGRVIQKDVFAKYSWGEMPEHAGERFSRSHATAVATIVAGNGETNDGSTPFIGVCPRAELWNYKISPSTPRGSDVAAALEAAFRDGARTINLSWGKKDTDIDGESVWARTVDALFERGVIVCKSAGNTGPKAGTISSPADARFVISVGAAELDGSSIQEGSSRGPTLDGREKPECHSPGGGVFAGSYDSEFVQTSSPGTSYAAPFVSGAVALLRQRFPSASTPRIRDAIIRSGRMSSTVGAGSLNLLNIPRALELLEGS